MSEIPRDVLSSSWVASYKEYKNRRATCGGEMEKYLEMFAIPSLRWQADCSGSGMEWKN